MDEYMSLVDRCVAEATSPLEQYDDGDSANVEKDSKSTDQRQKHKELALGRDPVVTRDDGHAGRIGRPERDADVELTIAEDDPDGGDGARPAPWHHAANDTND